MPKWAAAVLSLACGAAAVVTLYAIAGLSPPFIGVAIASPGAGTGNGEALIQLAVTVAGVWIAWVSYSLFALHVDMAGMKTDLAGVKADLTGLKGAMAGLKTAIAGLKGRR